MNEVQARYNCETKIQEKLKEIYEIYKEYNPDGDYLGFTISNEYIMCNNKYWEGGDDEKKPLHFIITVEQRGE